MNTIIKTTLFSAFLLNALPSYSQTCNSTVALSTPTNQFTLNTNGTVTDNKTELTWMRCSLGQTWSESDSNCTGTATLHTWEGALVIATKTSFAQQSDWRLPNIKELASIVERRCYSPAINATVFPNTTSSFYWSSSPYANDYNYAWVVYFNYGSGGYNSEGGSPYVRLVRGGQ